MLRQIFHRTMLAGIAIRHHPRRRSAGGIPRTDNLLECLLVPDLHGLLDCRVFDDQEPPFLGIPPIGRGSPGFEDLLDQLIRHRVRLQPPHRPRCSNDFKEIRHVMSPLEHSRAEPNIRWKPVKRSGTGLNIDGLGSVSQAA